MHMISSGLCRKRLAKRGVKNICIFFDEEKSMYMIGFDYKDKNALVGGKTLMKAFETAMSKIDTIDLADGAEL